MPGSVEGFPEPRPSSPPTPLMAASTEPNLSPYQLNIWDSFLTRRPGDNYESVTEIGELLTLLAVVVKPEDSRIP